MPMTTIIENSHNQLICLVYNCSHLTLGKSSFANIFYAPTIFHMHK